MERQSATYKTQTNCPWTLSANEADHVRRLVIRWIQSKSSILVQHTKLCSMSNYMYYTVVASFTIHHNWLDAINTFWSNTWSCMAADDILLEFRIGGWILQDNNLQCIHGKTTTWPLLVSETRRIVLCIWLQCIVTNTTLVPSCCRIQRPCRESLQTSPSGMFELGIL